MSAGLKMVRPSLETARLLLRPFVLSDAPDIQRLAGDFAVADTTLNMPHPYEEGMAEEWISSHASRYKTDDLVAFAITLKNEKKLIGGVGLTMTKRDKRAELGYWIGKPFWNQGYATEAVKALIQFGFTTVSLHKIVGQHFVRNPASGRVMQKLGMTREGLLRQHAIRWGQIEDVVFYGLLSNEWNQKL